MFCKRVLWIFFAISSWTSAETSPEIIPPKSENVIAYPGGTMHMNRGLFGCFLGGLRRNSGDNQNLYQWQGEMGYYYTPWFSSGLGFKLIAGEPSDSTQIVKNRFFLLGRFHKAWPRFSGYVGAQLGVDDLNISLPVDTLSFRGPLKETNAGMGLEFGAGWKFSRFVGATFGHRFEFSFVGEQGDGNSVNFRTMPGLSFDVLSMLPSLRKSVKALNLTFEMQIGSLVLEIKSKSQELAGITGLSAGF